MNTVLENIRRLYVGISITLLNTILLAVIVAIVLEFIAGWLLRYQASSQDVATALVDNAYEGMAWKEQFFKDVAAYQVATGGAQVYEPYSLWKNPDFRSPSFTVEQGYRKTVQPVYTQEDSVVHIWMFGGSTMFCADTPDDWTIASRLAYKLREAYPNRKFKISNYGLPGFVCDQEAILLSKLLMSGQCPDVTIFYDGFNEAHLKVAMAKPIPHGFYTMYEQIYRSIKERLWANLVWKSSFLTLAMRSLSRDTQFEKDERVLQARSQVVAASYARVIDFVQHLAQVYGFRAYFFWQPSLLTTGKKLTANEAALRNMILQNNGPGYRILLETVRATIFRNPDMRVQYTFDINDALDSVNTTAFVDYAHLGPYGNDAVAEKMLQCLRSRGLL
ncbi:MAG: hypothetical protein RML40_03155 [Bacteroidota bacterium]|nr:hypothetical protein [Candidatus Kapabacteria bacterium]MDW8219508.1 hypothetical protein [Bacteroidota bacterium]